MNTDFYHELVWKRYVRMPYGHVLDYADKNGNVYIPTVEDCKKCMPNPLGWWTPIENGAFFTGLYAYTLIEKYNKFKDEKTANEVDILINGLFLLQDVGNVEGFIARGVSDDGKSHYPFSSEDQFIPWVLALYAYYKSDLCACKAAIKDRLLRALIAVKNCNWMIPCDVKGLYRDGWANSGTWRGAAKMLFCARVIFELTHDEKDLMIFNNLANGYPQDCVYNRLEIISHGYAHDMVAFLGVNSTWVCVCAHLAVRELLLLDAANKEYYKKGLYNNGVTALAVVDNMKKYDNQKDGFNIDWRAINKLWEYYDEDVQKGEEIACRENAYWVKEVVPHRYMEHEVLGNAVFAAWVAITCEEKKISELAAKKLSGNCDYIDWDNLHLSYAFAVESALIFSCLCST